MSIEKFNTPSMRAAFTIWHTNDNDVSSVDYGRAEHTALEVHAWAVEDAGRHENKKGIYVSVMFGSTDESERRYVSFSLTRKQLRKLMDDVNARYPVRNEHEVEQ